MKYKKEKSLLYENFESMSLESLQKYCVSLIDAIREANAEYGMKQAIQNGFYIELEDFAGNGYTPRDFWLQHNLSERLKLVQSHLNMIYDKEETT